MSGAILITGGTGFLGMELLARLLEADDGPEVFLAVRARDELEAELRAARVLGTLYETVPASAARVRAVPADLTRPRLGLTASDRSVLAAEVERVVHCAASVAFTLPLAQARAINVQGTRRMLELARELPRLERFVHVSTAYVAGRVPGVFTETDPGGSGFRNSYEASKAEAETAVAAAAEELPVAVVRPSIVVGEADSGWTPAFNVLYWPMQAFARGLLDEVPADPHGIVDMVPVDYVAAVIERALFTAGAAGRFHAVAADSAVTVGELLVEVCRELDRPRPELTAPGSVVADDPIAVFAPYFDVATRFDDRRARRLMGGEELAPDPVGYLPALIDYAREARWGKRPLSREAARILAGLGPVGTASA